LYGAFGRDFLLVDGERVMIVAITKKQWASLVRALGLATDIVALERASGLKLDHEGDRFRARFEIAALVERWCASRTSVEVRETLDAHGVSWAPYSSALDFAKEFAPLHAGTDGFGTPSETCLVSDVGLPIRIDDDTPHALGAAPALGEHTEHVLAELLGLSAREIGRLHDEGLVAGPKRQERK